MLPAPEVAAITDTGNIMATAKYISPEQATGGVPPPPPPTSTRWASSFADPGGSDRGPAGDRPASPVATVGAPGPRREAPSTATSDGSAGDPHGKALGHDNDHGPGHGGKANGNES
jgi:hypothetical protein